MVILLIGPSAIGKTTLGRICASQIAEYDFIDLDEVIARSNNTSTAYQSAQQFGLARFLRDCREIVARYDSKYANANSILIIAVGEWALRMDKLETWLSTYRTISLMAPEDEVFQRRNQLTDISFENYCRFNYSEARKRIYASCHIALDIGHLTQEQAVEKLIQAIENLRKQISSAR